MHHLSAETGGSDFDALHTKVDQAFERIAEELRSLYSVAYHSTDTKRDGSFRRVVITSPDPSYRVQARSGYYAR